MRNFHLNKINGFAGASSLLHLNYPLFSYFYNPQNEPEVRCPKDRDKNLAKLD
jgi:hypothetical protein